MPGWIFVAMGMAMSTAICFCMGVFLSETGFMAVYSELSVDVRKNPTIFFSYGILE